MKLLFGFLLVFVTTGLFAQKKQSRKDNPLAALDTTFNRLLKETNGAGFAVAVVKKDQVIFSQGFGYRDMEKKLPVTDETLFAIGSCSKAFTASLIGLLQQNNGLDYDKPATNYLPELHFYNDYLTDHVTVRDMLCHRTGLPRHDLSWFLFNSSSKDSLVKRIQYLQPTAELREKWQYNNFMYLALGKIVEQMTGHNWEENVQEKLLNPLGMSSSNVDIKGLENGKNASLGYTVLHDSIIKKVDYYNINGMSPAGSINSNVSDMAKWVMAWIHGGKYGGKQIIPASFVQEAMSSQMVINSALPTKELPGSYLSNYGFAWMITSYRGHYQVSHGGNINGFSANTCFFPSDSIGIVVLSNQNGSVIPNVVTNIISDRMLGLEQIDWTTKSIAQLKRAGLSKSQNKTSDKVPNTKPSHSLADYAGEYQNPGYGSFTITYQNDSLIMSIPEGNIWLRHYHYDVFELFGIDEQEGIDTTEGSELKIQFHSSLDGKIDAASMPLQAGLADIQFTKKEKTKTLSKSELEEYVGDYELRPGVMAKFYIKDEKTLYAFIKGQPEYELSATEKDRFKIKILEGFSVQFERDAEGKIISVTFIQPNGKFNAKKTD
ncbi:MAG: serine hydrolase [Chitinophagaceae bacterium]|nr:serine hydrolase [Chitinophagaceae bacterium]